MPVPQGDITSSQIFNTPEVVKEEPKATDLISQINSIMMAGGYGENKAGEILKLVLKDVKLSRKTMKEFVPLVEPDWSGSTGWDI
jgi:hypothetical protein